MNDQPPSGGCVLKLHISTTLGEFHHPQPPSGGCVLKLGNTWLSVLHLVPAAFGRLCVETPAITSNRKANVSQPPSGGCVLKQERSAICSLYRLQPPSGGCVLKPRVLRRE